MVQGVPSMKVDLSTNSKRKLSMVLPELETVVSFQNKKQKLDQPPKSSEPFLPNDILALIFEQLNKDDGDGDSDDIASKMTTYVLSNTTRLWRKMWRNDTSCLGKYYDGYGMKC